VRGLGVSSTRRSLIFPDIPTIAEAGLPGYETNSWGGMVVPARTPRAIVLKLNAEINKALQSPDLRARYAAIEAEPSGGSPEEFAAYVKTETIKWADVVKKAGVKIE
jgi:tripartite-type tricarboxylate transporter receptor subunit TctC